MAEHDVENDETGCELPPNCLCVTCSSITIQALASTQGFKHLTVGSTLQRSAERCSLCRHLAHFTKQAAGVDNGKDSADGCTVRLKLKRYGFDAADPSFGAVIEVLFEDYKPVLFEHDFFAVNTTTKIDPAIAFGVLPINHVTKTSSKKAFSTARSWVNDCLKYHPQCSQQFLKSNGSAQPKRLIELHPSSGPSSDNPKIRLIELSGATHCPKYIALSYCWGYGSGKSYTTTKDNVRLHRDQIPYAKLPATLKDAVCICKKLGMKYLWIDALCIIQDCSSDVVDEVAKMAMVYHKAWLTVSVDISKASTDGCFNDKRERRLSTLDNGVGFKVEIPTALDDGSKSNLQLFAPVATFPRPDNIQSTPLTARAWTFQEQALSRRILHYTSSGLVWECRKGFMSQDNILHWDRSSSTLPWLPIKLSASSEMEILHLWYHEILTTSYCLRMLTFPSDRLPAISAVAALFQQHLQSPYLAGIWLKNIEIGLSWQCFGFRKGKDPKNARPSWSWVSQLGMVVWPISRYYLHHEFITMIEIISFDTSLTDRALPLGSVTNGTLVVLGSLSLLRVRKIPAEDERYITYELFDEGQGRKLGKAIPDFDMEDEMEVSCLALFCRLSKSSPWGFSVWFLLLSPVAGEPEAYTRSGVAEIDQVDNWKSLGSQKTSRITLL
ncbi:HET-domain-containing protein [Triangularia verruculosa]|uniref:HET-domain-containing protein n=1 Tax=Triangularia verruculosa TaxID=2587418 RepID=A0AAN7AUR7_9PEZI|nr:HET-domain-containing protein [Triangularia verruculosa]